MITHLPPEIMRQSWHMDSHTCITPTGEQIGVYICFSVTTGTLQRMKMKREKFKLIFHTSCCVIMPNIYLTFKIKPGAKTEPGGNKIKINIMHYILATYDLC